MARRIVILLLVSSAPLTLLQFSAPAAGTAAGVPASFAATADPDEDGVFGECAWPRAETDRRHQAALFAAVLACAFPAARRSANDFRARGRGPTLASLSDSLILSRPPPAAVSRRESPGPIDANRQTWTRRRLR